MYLGIETSGAISSIALMDEQGLGGELTVQAGLTHSESLVPHIESLLAHSKVEKSHIQGIAVSIGPGSFTGLRIGLGTAKALAYAWQVPLLGIKTMDVWATNFMYAHHEISVIIDAQKKQVYEGRYRFDDHRLVCLQEAVVKQRADLLKELQERETPLIIVGDGTSRLVKDMESDELGVEGFPMARVAPPKLQVPYASHLLERALPIFKAGQFPSIDEVEPYYIRRSEAEVMWEERHPELANDPNRVQPTVVVRETAEDI